MRTITTALLTGVGVLALTSAALTGVSAAAPAQSGYVVVLHGAQDPAAFATGHVDRHGGQVGHIYQHALRGFSATLTAGGADALRRDPRVASVEPDRLMHTTDTVPTGVDRANATANPNLKINGSNDYSVDVDVAVIDTGVAQHPDLNVVARTNCVNSTTCTNNSGADDHGHGTHVAGTIGARDDGAGVVGMAPGARIWSAKVLGSGGSGSLSGVTAGVDWVAANAAEIEVANMSLGCDNCTDAALGQAITNAVAKGVVFVVAAGNNHKDAKTFFPANLPDVVTVSALADFNGKPGGGASSTCRADQDDTLADFSNFGSTVEIAAPGTCINSTHLNGGYKVLSGTSMAAPHVAGAAGLLTANGNRATGRDGVLAVRQRLIDTANTDWTDDSGDNVKEPLLDVRSTQDYPAGAADPGRPTAAFAGACSTSNTTCSFDAAGSTDTDGTITGYAWDFGDGTTGTGKTASHTYGKAAYYSVRLTVTDNAGKTNTTRRMVKAGDLPPTAAFTVRCQRDVCSFDGGASTDEEGAVGGFAWAFGDGTTGTGKTTTHSYPNITKVYQVNLTVSDSRGQTGSTSRQVRCSKHITNPLCFAI
ncbi:Serine protease, subtilisin family [Actinokineospora alba]|uniref:Serine protease, subtilisin family n=1 Tax=Actinokineospora alba TaxID=504798 RepID=A0A1H0LXU4_9PSEU|nr:S8 family serine peptidase [Actinokineospora alba]TDP67503.1 subtilisin family serine protease [Actinokineospora alba]SDI46871.1 Serine protease, subtilisin family [Actinokineospora alba]SDO73049.1 Serine protease, subtilisin family [Actinokineospora alba]